MKNSQPPYSIFLSSDYSQETRAAEVRAHLNQYNFRLAGPDGYTPLQIFLLGEHGQVAGGLLGGTYWGWLSIDILWVQAELRGAGHGRELLTAAEAEAVRRGCRHAHVDTLDFQAPEFYMKHGYTVWGTLDDLPPGHQRLFFRKDLAVMHQLFDKNAA